MTTPRIPTRLFPAGSRGPLPYDEEVAYIGTDGHEYVLTGVAPDDTIRITGSFKWREIVAQARLFSSNDGGREYSLYRGSSAISARCGSNGTTITFNKGADGTVYDFTYTATSVTINGTTKGIGGNHPASTLQFALFGRNNSGTVLYEDYPMKCDLYWLKIEKGGTALRDLRPVRAGYEFCLYDRVSGALFRNAGTGAFLGPS